MNRETVLIGAALTAAVIVVFGIAIYFEFGGADDGPEPITGPGRAAEARGIIAEIEERRAGEPGAQPAAGVIAPAGETAAGDQTGAAALVPGPEQPAPTGAGADLDAAYERALELQAAGQLDDAQVLLFFGARRGHAPSAFAYAELNDPNHHSPERSLLEEPDAFQAFRWYSAALDGGLAEASGRLDALREWAQDAAGAGDAEAERLLLQWEQ